MPVFWGCCGAWCTDPPAVTPARRGRGRESPAGGAGRGRPWPARFCRSQRPQRLRGQGRPQAVAERCAQRTVDAGGAAADPGLPARDGSPRGVSAAGGGGVPGRGRGFRHCQAHIRVSDPQVGYSQDGAPHLWRESARSKHSRGSFLPRRASRYTASLRGPGLAPAPGKGVRWSSPPTRSRPARGRPPPRRRRAACRGRSSSCTWRAAAAAPSMTGPASPAAGRPAGA